MVEENSCNVYGAAQHRTVLVAKHKQKICGHGLQLGVGYGHEAHQLRPQAVPNLRADGKVCAARQHLQAVCVAPELPRGYNVAAAKETETVHGCEWGTPGMFLCNLPRS